MILQKKEELANRQLRLTITVERDAWEKALNDAYQEVKALYRHHIVQRLSRQGVGHGA